MCQLFRRSECEYMPARALRNAWCIYASLYITYIENDEENDIFSAR